MQSLQNAMQTQFWAVREYLAPVLKDSKFKEHGRITPDEYVAAGEFLVYKFPTWQWEGGDKTKARDYLPADKQYLVQRNVPCIRRVSQMQNYAGGDEQEDEGETLMSFRADELIGESSGADDGEDWVATHTGSKGKSDDAPGEIPDIPDASATAEPGGAGLQSQLQSLNLREDRTDAAQSANAVPDLDDIPDMDDDDALGAGGVEEPEDEAAAAPITSQVHALGSGAGNTLSVRTYDCYITYDKFHQVPRMWLSGLSPSRQPLTTAEIFQDIAGDYAQKTVTIEPFPHRENVTMASVHPCKHANVMKKVIERMNGAVREQQRRDRAAAEGEILSPGATPASPEAAAKKKKGWGITSAVKKAAGVGSSSASGAGAGASALPAEEDVEGLRVDQYLLVFLKFMSNVVPTIELDATTSL